MDWLQNLFQAHSAWRTLVVLAVIYVVAKVLQLHERLLYRTIPGPVGVPFFGNLLSIGKKDLVSYFEECRNRYGNLFKLWIGPDVWIILTDPELSRIACTRMINRFPIPSLMTGENGKLDSAGLVEARDEKWSLLRQTWQPAFKSSSLEGYAPLMDECAKKLCAKLDAAEASGKSVEIWREIGKMTMQVVGSSAYGIDFHVLDPTEDKTKDTGLIWAAITFFKYHPFGMASVYLTLSFMCPYLSSLLKFMVQVFPDRVMTELIQARMTVMQTTSKLISDWRAEHFPKSKDGLSKPEANTRLQGAKSKGQGIAPGSFLDLMLDEVMQEGKPKFEDIEVIAQCNTFLLAGYETTANAIAFAVYLLSINSEAEAKLREEVDRFFSAGDNGIGGADLAKFPYVEAVVKETLRLFNPVPFILREAKDDMRLDGHLIPKGTRVIIPFSLFQRNPVIWPKASAFMPERFLQGHADLEPTRQNAYTPFGSGARMCVGWKFAMQEVIIGLVRLYHHYTFKLVDGQVPLKTKVGITMCPQNGLHVLLKKRGT